MIIYICTDLNKIPWSNLRIGFVDRNAGYGNNRNIEEIITEAINPSDTINQPKLEFKLNLEFISRNY